MDTLVVVKPVVKETKNHFKDRETSKDESRNINDKVSIERLKAAYALD